MTRKLQFFLTALLLMVGVTSAWAQTTIYASKQINFRTNSNSAPTGWDTGDWAAPKTNKDGLNIESIEANTKNEKPIFALEQFVIPNWSNVKSITITHKGTINSGGLAVWLFPYYYWEGNNWDILETTDPNYSATEYGSDFVKNAKTVFLVQS